MPRDTNGNLLRFWIVDGIDDEIFKIQQFNQRISGTIHISMLKCVIDRGIHPIHIHIRAILDTL
jgi:hypothetical protein